MARLLVIDDQEAVLATVRTILESRDHSVVTTTRAGDGIALLTLEAFDLLIVDIFMPEMDGIETIRIVRHNRPLLPIIVMSGSVVSPAGPAPDFLAMTTRLGAIRILRKPFKRADLMEAVDACLIGTEPERNAS
jgi:CheY-like chemotaxis protein